MHYWVLLWNYEIVACLKPPYYLYRWCIDHVTPILLGKIKESLSCRVGFYFVCQLRVIFYLFAISFFFPCGEITCVWALNHCLIYRFLQQFNELTRSRAIYCITRCEKIIEYTGTPVNIDEKDNLIVVNH